MIRTSLVSMVIRPALVGLGVTGLLLVGGCKTATEKWLFENNNPPPNPLAAPGETSKGKRSGLVPDSEAVVLPPELVSMAFSWESKETGRVTYYAYYGWSEDSITNLFGVTDNWAITNSIPWPYGEDNVYGAVYAQNSVGRSDASYTARLPDWPANAVKVDSVPHINAQVMLWESPNLRHWAGYWTRLPSTNSITTTTFFKIAPELGGAAPGLVPVTLTIEPLRLWNAEKKHFGG